MKVKGIHIIAVIILVLWFAPSVWAEDIGPSEYETAFLDMINAARENPLAVAASMGMDPNRIVLDFPERRDIITEGLPSLTADKNLYEAARVHTEEMLEEGYYGYDSLDGRTYGDRIRETGYIAVASSESLGLSGFSNFIDPAESARTMFERMFRDQLDPTAGEQWTILDPDLTHVGIALGAGTLNLGGYTFNAYIVTCDFGRSLDRAGMHLIQLINQARLRPLDVATSLGMDPEQILADLPELQDTLKAGLPPLTFNADLYKAARAHVEDMLENGYYLHDSPDGRTYEDRIRETGYDPTAMGEIMGLQCMGSDAALEEPEILVDQVDRLVFIMFKKLFVSELQPDTEERTILNPALKEVGVGIITGTSSELGGICGDNLLFMVADFGASIAENLPCIEGVVYSDLDQDTLYTPGEGISQVAVSVEDLSGDDTSRPYNLYTGEAGGFGLPVTPGAYRISVKADGYEMVEDVNIEVGEENRMIQFGVQPLSEEDDVSETGANAE
ncbi:MAG TPA: CAP domain-containing protein [Syntrophales bacterium]|nr:CAP domain-containing protein [Syntrophales bacterium]